MVAYTVEPIGLTVCHVNFFGQTFFGGGVAMVAYTVESIGLKVYAT